MASWNPMSRLWNIWSGSSGGRLVQIGELGRARVFSLVFRLQTWSVGVQQVRQPCLLQGDCLVQILWDS